MRCVAEQHFRRGPAHVGFRQGEGGHRRGQHRDGNGVLRPAKLVTLRSIVHDVLDDAVRGVDERVTRGRPEGNGRAIPKRELVEQGADTGIVHVHLEGRTARCGLGVPIEVGRRIHCHLHRVDVLAPAERLFGLEHRGEHPRLIKRMLHGKADPQATVRERPCGPPRIFGDGGQRGRGVFTRKNVHTTEVDGRRGKDLHDLLEGVVTAPIGRHLSDGEEARVRQGQCRDRVIRKPESAEIEHADRRPHTLIHRREAGGGHPELWLSVKKAVMELGRMVNVTVVSCAPHWFSPYNVMG